jgi:ribonuclease J
VAEGGGGIIRDRRHLCEDGVIVVVAVVDGRTGELIDGPDLESHGFVEEPAPTLARAAEAVAEDLRSMAGGPPDLEVMRKRMVQAVNRVTRGEKSRKAVVIPIVLET